MSGDRYIGEAFGYDQSHLWRNYGILVAYLIFFMVAYGLAVEFVPQLPKGRGDVLLFRRRQDLRKDGKLSKREDAIKDIESNPGGALNPLSQPSTKTRIFRNLERSNDSLTWDRLNYQVPVKGGMKKLLIDVQGYVKPGTLTGWLKIYSSSVF